MSRYLLPCSCGKKHSVAAPQAGGTIACECGRNLPIPGLRDLRMLAPDEQSSAAAPATAVPGAVNPMGLIFAVSLCLLIAGLPVAGYCGYVLTQIDTHDHTDEVLQMQMEGLDKLSGDRVFDLWKNVTVQPLEYEQPHYLIARQVHGRYLNFALVAGALAGLGLLGVVYSIWNGPGKKAASEKPRV